MTQSRRLDIFTDARFAAGRIRLAITKVDRDRVGQRRLLFLTRRPVWKAPLLY